MDKYTVHMVSFRNTKETNAFSTLLKSQKAADWQIEELEKFVGELRAESTTYGSDLV